MILFCEVGTCKSVSCVVAECRVGTAVCTSPASQAAPSRSFQSRRPGLLGWCPRLQPASILMPPTPLVRRPLAYAAGKGASWKVVGCTVSGTSGIPLRVGRMHRCSGQQDPGHGLGAAAGTLASGQCAPQMVLPRLCLTARTGPSSASPSGKAVLQEGVRSGQKMSGIRCRVVEES